MQQYFKEERMDTKFSVAVHSLVLISESQVPINSNQIALSVGTNASYIRKILSLLKKAGIIQSHRGTGAYVLKTTPDEIDTSQYLQKCHVQRGNTPS